MKILGICAYYQNSGAALVINGEIVAAIQETSFTSVTHIAIPVHSISYCLKETGIEMKDLDGIVFYEKPLSTSELLHETYAPLVKGFNLFQVMPSQLDKQFFRTMFKKKLAAFGNCKRSELPPVEFIEHNQSQATSAFFLSPFQRAAVICINSVDEWATASVWLGRDNQLIRQWNFNFPNSFKMLCDAFTYYTGIQFNFDECRLRELAQYGEPKYASLLLDKLLQFNDNGIQIDSDYVYKTMQLTMTNKKSDQIFKAFPQLEIKTSQWEMDIAASIQKVIEEIILRLVDTVYRRFGENYLCLAGDVHHHILSSKIMHKNYFRDIWIQPKTDYSRSAALAVWLNATNSDALSII